jgi:hypothetical protein
MGMAPLKIINYRLRISQYHQAHCGLAQQGLVAFILISKYCSVAFYGKYFYAHSCICFWHVKNK